MYVGFDRSSSGLFELRPVRVHPCQSRNSQMKIWRERLPDELRAWVIWPRQMEQFRDAEIPASKWRGIDLRGDLCYYRHRFTLWEDVYDDEEPYRRLVLSESVEAWRAIDGRWLKRVRRTEGGGRCKGVLFDSGFQLMSERDFN